MMVRFLAEGEAWSSAPDAGERGCKAGASSSARPVESSVLDCHAEVQPILCKDRKIIYTVQLFPELLVIQTLNHDTSAHSSRASLPEPL